jgi:hypothetical protein
VTDKGDLPELVRDLYAAGAEEIHLEINNRAKPGKLYVRLPDTKSARAACLKVYREYVKKWSLAVDPKTIRDQAQQYLVVELKQ